ncbi:ABC transporter permease [Hymenobacter weizhouensis]|uniref:ABC transporter permease n=1 Tax=Hymenobacter sp. YIM 151500-1 TaxID=2987689 RepID=UPI00222690D8|nr:ABC transporter permease [Hymenobacter sp. YIM 151500-1]UYZ62828.1 ABC transporter permease [Hymenobacter sp. YIM 151500-1]
MSSAPTLALPRPSALTQLARCLSVDMLKLRRTAALWLTLGGGALPVLLNFLIFYFKGDKLLKPGQNPWPAYISMSWQTASVLLLPLFVVLLSSLVLALEHRSEGWKHLLVQPVGRGAAYGSKLLVLLGLNALAQSLYVVLLLASGVVLGWLRPGLGFQSGLVEVAPLLLMLAHTFVATLGILGVQFAAALALRSFVGPLALGIGGIVTALTLLRWEHSDLIPYAASTKVLSAFEGGKQGELLVKTAMSSSEWWSLAWFAVAAVAGYALLRWRRAAG